jgi:hypothetical protein
MAPRVLIEQVGSGGDAIDFYSSGASFESRLGHILSGLGVSWLSSVREGEFRQFKLAHGHFLSHLF